MCFNMNPKALILLVEIELKIGGRLIAFLVGSLILPPFPRAMKYLYLSIMEFIVSRHAGL